MHERARSHYLKKYLTPGYGSLWCHPTYRGRAVGPRARSRLAGQAYEGLSDLSPQSPTYWTWCPIDLESRITCWAFSKGDSYVKRHWDLSFEISKWTLRACELGINWGFSELHPFASHTLLVASQPDTVSQPQRTAHLVTDLRWIRSRLAKATALCIDAVLHKVVLKEPKCGECWWFNGFILVLYQLHNGF